MDIFGGFNYLRRYGIAELDKHKDLTATVTALAHVAPTQSRLARGLIVFKDLWPQTSFFFSFRFLYIELPIDGLLLYC
jgi:hypothetical protein